MTLIPADSVQRDLYLRLFSNYAPNVIAATPVRPWGGALSTRACVLDHVYFYPLPLARTISVSQVAIDVVTASAATGVVRLGIYSASSFAPSALVSDFGTVAADSLGLKTLVLASTLILAPGLYWQAVVSQVAATATLRALAIPPLMIPVSITQSNLLGCLGQASVSGALPATPTPASPSGGPVSSPVFDMLLV